MVSKQAVFGTLTIPGGNAGEVLMNAGAGKAIWSASPESLATITAGVTPAGLAISADGTVAFVANNNNYAATAGNFVSVLDVVTNLPLTKISSDTFNQPYTVTLSNDGSVAYVTNSAGSTISMIDTTSYTVTGVISGFDGPSGMVIMTGNIGYVNNYGASGGVGSGNGTTVSVVNLITNTITDTITVDQAPAALALSPDEKYVYVINYVTGVADSGTLSVVATASNTVTHTVTGFFGPFGIAVHPSGLLAYVTNFGSNNFDPFGTTVSVVDLSTYSIVTTVEVGIQPAGVACSSDGKYVYISNYNTLYQDNEDFTGLTAGQGTVNAIDTSTNSLVASYTAVVGQSPGNIFVSPFTHRVYVSNFTSNTISVLQGL
jgi:YVTN family beta-propeller protein